MIGKKYLMTFEELVKFNKDMSHASTMSFEQVTENWLEDRGKKPVEYKPKETVIARGIVERDSTTCRTLKDFVYNIDGFVNLPKENLKGKKVQIIIREVTD